MQLDALSPLDPLDWKRPCSPTLERAPACVCHHCARELEVNLWRQQWLQDAEAGAPICLDCHHDRRQAQARQWREAALDLDATLDLDSALHGDPQIYLEASMDPDATLHRDRHDRDVREEVTLAVAMAGLTLGWMLAGPLGSLIGLGVGALAGRYARPDREWHGRW